MKILTIVLFILPEIREKRYEKGLKMLFHPYMVVGGGFKRSKNWLKTP